MDFVDGRIDCLNPVIQFGKSAEILKMVLRSMTFVIHRADNCPFCEISENIT